MIARRLVLVWACQHGAPLCDAEDIAQVSVERLLKWPRLLRYPVGNWIYRLARQCAQEHGRWSRLTTSVVDDLPCCEEDHGEYSAAEVQAAFGLLSQREQYALGYRFVAGLSLRSVASVIECQEEATQKTIQRSRQRLKAILLAVRQDRENIVSEI